MSYTVTIYERQVKEEVEQSGKELDEVTLVPFAEEDLALFLERLLKYGYTPEDDRSPHREFIRNVNGCPIQVAVFKTEIAFSVPYWDGAEDAIFDALQDAAELSDNENWILFDPQTGEWIE